MPATEQKLFMFWVLGRESVQFGGIGSFRFHVGTGHHDRSLRWAERAEIGSTLIAHAATGRDVYVTRVRALPEDA